MLTIGIVDDGVGVFPTLNKIKQAISAKFICLVVDQSLSEASPKQLLQIGANSIQLLSNLGCDAVVLSSVVLSARCYRQLVVNSPVALFGCEAPVNHASTYTASHVLVAGEPSVLSAYRLQGVIACPMPNFSALAELGNERDIVNYISLCCEPYYGQFDCIALASSCMNMYRYCFSRVFPNVQIFDSLEGVARRIRKKYKKCPKEDSICTVIDAHGNEITEKYSIFME